MIGFALFFSTNFVYARPPFDSQELFDFSDSVVLGKVINVNSTFSPTTNLYQIQVEKFFKNPQDSEIIFAAGGNVVNSRAGVSVFNTGDRKLFFLTHKTIDYHGYPVVFLIGDAQSVEPDWDKCNIFEKEIPPEHWIFGGSGATPKISQGNNSQIENFKINKMISVSYDVSNISNTRQEFDFTGILSRQNGTASEKISTASNHIVLEPCTVFKTVEWRFTTGGEGSYYFEIKSDPDMSYGIGFIVKDSDMEAPLKQFKSGISPSEIVCKNNLQLVIRSSNNFPVCVTQESIQKLIERGWMDSIEYYNRQCQNSPWTCSQQVPMDLIDADKLIADSAKQNGFSFEENQKKIILMALSDAKVEKLFKSKEYFVFQVRKAGVWLNDNRCPENGCALVGFSTVKSKHLGVTMSIILNPLTGEVFDINAVDKDKENEN